MPANPLPVNKLFHFTSILHQILSFRGLYPIVTNRCFSAKIAFFKCLPGTFTGAFSI
jgi:hypothetical protein